jgi:hypothetical protein
VSLRGDEWIVGPGDHIRPPRQREPQSPPTHRPQRRRTRRDRGPIWTSLRAVVAVGVTVGAGIGVYEVAQMVTPDEIETVHFTNARAGYSFDYPKGWQLVEDDTRTTIKHPDSVVLVSFGVGPQGSLAEASDVLVSQIEENTESVQTGSAETQTIAGHESLVVNGTGVNQQGAGLRFLAVTVHVDERTNYSIVLFAAREGDPEQIVAPTQVVLESFTLKEG